MYFHMVTVSCFVRIVSFMQYYDKSHIFCVVFTAMLCAKEKQVIPHLRKSLFVCVFLVFFEIWMELDLCK